MKNLHHKPQWQKSCWRLKGIVVIRHVFSSVLRRTLLVNKIVLSPSRTSSSSTHQFSDVLPSPLMPMIGFKGLGRTSENWWVEEDEVLDGDNTILLTRSVLRNTLEKTCLIMTIPFSLQHD